MPRAVFIQVSNANGIDYLERFQFALPVNVYTSARDVDGCHLLRIGCVGEPGADAREYSGHRYIVRCRSRELLAQAEPIVRRKLGLAPIQPKFPPA